MFVYLDCDAFKRYHDTYGHLAGDTVLRQVGQVLRHHVRAGDGLGRLGGDEFGWCGPIRSVEPLTDRVAAARTAGVTLCAGAAWWPPGQAPIPVQALTHLADVALYQAKALGTGR